MEDDLKVSGQGESLHSHPVSILVLMEDDLKVEKGGDEMILEPPFQSLF